MRLAFWCTWTADTSAVNTASIIIAIERFAFVVCNATESLMSKIPQRLRVVHVRVVAS